MRDGSICLATMLDIARISVFVRLANGWPGAISAAVLSTASTVSWSSSEQDVAATALDAVHDSRHRVRLTLVENTG
jgi:hypothetical protein